MAWNGQTLFYEYQVTLENNTVGLVKASASKVLGSPVPIQLGPRRWTPEVAIRNARERAKKLYPTAKISQTEFVCYSYPKIGVKVDLMGSKQDPKSVIFDVASTDLVDRSGSDELLGFTSWSFYDEIAERDLQNGEARWDAIDKELEAVKRAIPRIFEPKIIQAKGRALNKPT